MSRQLGHRAPVRQSVVLRLLGGLLRVFALTLGAAALLCLIYIAAAVVGAAWRPQAVVPQTTDRYRIVIAWSEIHTDIILPAEGVSVEWQRVLFDGVDTPLAPGAGNYAFGWGSESFYRGVPTMADMTPGLVATALLLDETVIHVAPVWDLQRIPATNRRTVEVSGAGLEALERFIVATLETGPQDRARVLPGETYGYGDAFYQAHGRYSPFRTCNQWTSEALRLAGIPVGTPFSQSIAWTMGSDADRRVR